MCSQSVKELHELPLRKASAKVGTFWTTAKFFERIFKKKMKKTEKTGRKRRKTGKTARKEEKRRGGEKREGREDKNGGRT